jgi:hypothetical protein
MRDKQTVTDSLSEQNDGHIDGAQGQINRQTEGCTNQLGSLLKTDRQANRWSDRQIDKQRHE